MRYSRFLVLGFLLVSPISYAQSPSTDSQTLQALLQEMRGLRQDLRAVTVSTQRAQILLFRLQLQNAAVARAQQRLDDARSRFADMQMAQKTTEAELKQVEDLREHSQVPAEKKEMDDALVRIKARLETMDAEVQQAQTKETEAEGQLRSEQAKLDKLQGELDQLERVLDSLTAKPDTRRD